MTRGRDGSDQHRRAFSTGAMILSFAALCGASAHAQDDQWQYRVTPYIWAPSLNLQAEIGPEPPAESDTELLEILNFAALVGFEARRGRWGLIGELNYLDLGDEATFAGGRVDVDTGLSGTMVSAALAYRAFADSRGSIDVYAGARYWGLESEVEFPSRTASSRNDFVDPIVGVRANLDFDDRWFAGVTADVGGFGVGSDSQWQAFGRVGYRFNETWALGAGYRHLKLDFDRDGTDIRAVMSGPVVTLDISW